MITFSNKQLKAYRTKSYRVSSGKRLSNPQEALDFVNQRGFLFLWPINGVEMPSLWTAVAGERPVADAHDDPGHITWGWKDDALDKRIWYYAKILRRKATFVSLAVTPYFYALSENYGSPDEDHIIAYEEGRLTLAAKQIYDVLLDKGAMDTISLRKEARLQNAKESIFNRALEDLQKDFKILPVGIAEAGAWRYSYRYELTSRHFPDLIEDARPIGEAVARRTLVMLYVRSVGATQMRDLVKLFGWPVELVQRCVDKLIQNGELVEAEQIEKPGIYLANPDLLD